MAETRRYHTKHGLGWQDGGSAYLRTCCGESLAQFDVILCSESEPVQCPRCGDWLNLRWDVYVEEVYPLAHSEKQT